MSDSTTKQKTTFDINKALDDINPLLQTSLTAAGLPTPPKPQPVRRPPARSISWLKVFGYSAVAAGAIGVLIAIFRWSGDGE